MKRNNTKNGTSIRMTREGYSDKTNWRHSFSLLSKQASKKRTKSNKLRKNVNIPIHIRYTVGEIDGKIYQLIMKHNNEQNKTKKMRVAFQQNKLYGSF